MPENTMSEAAYLAAAEREYALLRSNINCLIVTDDFEEAKDMELYAYRRINQLAQYCGAIRAIKAVKEA